MGKAKHCDECRVSRHVLTTENKMKFRFSYLRIQSDGAPIFKFVRHRNFSILFVWRLCFEFSTPVTYSHGAQWW